MKYRHLGNTGLNVSVIGLGTNQFGGKVSLQETRGIIDTAIDNGINFIDTADRYQQGKSEEFIGEVIQNNRHKIILATKVGLRVGENPNDIGASRYHIIESVNKSLKRLKTDYIDLYQIHRWDPNTPILETMSTLDDLIKSGKIRYIGASNFTAWQLILSNSISKNNFLHEFVTIQPHYHLLERSIEIELLPACQYTQVGIIPYFPLAGGFLTGKYRKGEPPPKNSRGEHSSYVQSYFNSENFAKLEILDSFAKNHGHTLSELAIAWLLARPMVNTVIAGATNPKQIIQNTKAAEWELSLDDMAEIDQLISSHQ